MAISDIDRLRTLLGEAIPIDGDEEDTLFTDEQIQDLLTRHTTVEHCLSEGWQMKAAMLSSLVDITEGFSKESLSQQHAQAMKMIQHYSPQKGVGQPVTRNTRIIRPGWFQG